MANWRSPRRAERVVVYEEGGEIHQYWRSEDHDGNVLWRKESEDARQEASGEAITTAVASESDRVLSAGASSSRARSQVPSVAGSGEAGSGAHTPAMRGRAAWRRPVEGENV